MRNLIITLTTRLRARRDQRRSTDHEPVLLHGTDTTDHHDPAGTPSAGYPHHYVPTGHLGTTGEPHRDEELAWIDAEIAHALESGILDEGNHHYLDALIDHRTTQWHAAIETVAHRRRHAADGLIATATYYLALARHDLATTRLAHATAAAAHAHLTTQLAGTHPAPINHEPTPIPSPLTATLHADPPCAK
ncbi:hypothetical protein N798_00220 [Knoellia flava TL1]|uniref:Uncharacterized protein n=2 Tax=Knoellia flava TaxID=913969 RepID=A0A8H9FWE7_9MICO|nr:hypothetical protein [Knoellia flava]KGN36008.1 hypothetical protein N798_00220 [Knoellia flava TL1]GGB81414.1 hypothetical protein GCM10011314_21280 [Knoellia flava]